MAGLKVDQFAKMQASLNLSSLNYCKATGTFLKDSPSNPGCKTFWLKGMETYSDAAKWNNLKAKKQVFPVSNKVFR